MLRGLRLFLSKDTFVWRGVLFVFCVLAIGYLFQNFQTTRSEELISSPFKDLEERYFLHVEYKNILSTVHESWLQAPSKMRAEPLEAKDIPLVHKVLQKAFAEYPDKVIQKNIKLIGVAKKIYMYDLLYGATYAYFGEPGVSKASIRSDIYMGLENLDKDVEMDAYLSDSFHHEFSSILLNEYDFPEEAWRKVNPKGFKYTHEESAVPGLEALKNKEFDQADDEMKAQGFLSEYAKASLEEDFNIFTGVAFVYPEWMFELAQKYESLNKKLHLWLKFYLSIDPDFAGKRVFKFYRERGYVFD